jgi:hypothetical protein
MRREQRNTSKLQAITPMPPEPSDGKLPSRPAVTPDTRVESFLWNLYLEQKSRADWAHKRYLDIEKKFETYRRNKVLSVFKKHLKPGEVSQ